MKWLLFLTVILSSWEVLWAPPTDTWSPNLNSLEGRLGALQSVYSRHPNLGTTNLLYRRSPMEPLVLAAELQKQPGAKLAPLELSTSSRLLVHQYSGKDLAPDEALVAQLREKLVENVRALPLSTLTTFEQDANQLVKDPNALAKFFSVAPFLYDPMTHEAISPEKLSGETRIQEQDYYSLSGVYRDTWPAHFWDTLAEREKFERGHSVYEKRFLATEVNPALVMRESDGQKTASKVISIERIPPLVALYRGFFGKDCSVLSAPFHALSPGARVYAIRDNDRGTSQPIAYAFSVEVELNGKKLPYILTTNGSLNEEGVKKVVGLVAKDYGTTEIVLPDFEKNPYLVNTADMQKGMIAANSTSVKVKLPEGWSAIDGFTASRNGTGYQNYYQGSQIETARLADVAGLTGVREVSVPQTYLPVTKVGAASLFSRATLASHALGKKSSPETHRDVLSHLNVTEAQLGAAASVVNALPARPMSVGDYERAHEEIGFGLAQITAMDTLTRAATLARLYREKKNLFKEAEWTKIAKMTAKELDRETPPAGAAAVVREMHLSALAHVASILPDRMAALEEKVLALGPEKAFQFAAKEGLISLMERLHKQGVNPRAGKEAALVAAARNGSRPAIEWLLAHGSNLHEDKDAALRGAVQSGHREVVEFLLEKGANIHADADESLVLAVKSGNLEMARLLISRGADVSTYSELPLRVALEEGDHAMTRLLLQNGANPDDLREGYLKQKKIALELRSLVKNWRAQSRWFATCRGPLGKLGSRLSGP